MPVRVLEEGHPELVIGHARNERGAVPEGHALGGEARMRRLDVRTRTQLAILVNRGHSPAA